MANLIETFIPILQQIKVDFYRWVNQFAKDPFILKVILIFIGIFLASSLFSLFSNRKQRNALMRLSDYLNGSLSKFLFSSPSFKGEYEGLKFSISLISVKNAPPRLDVKMYLNEDSSLRLRIDKKSFLNLPLAMRETRIADKMFAGDKEVSFFSYEPTQATTYLENKNVIAAIRELLENGFIPISINRKGIVINKDDYDLEKDLEPEKVMKILQKLNSLAGRL